MILTKNQSEISSVIEKARLKKPDLVVGFVPTMGALHQGHISLINVANKQCDIVICSVFVNPTQFNNSDDLETYPRNFSADQKLLNDNGCTILLLPSVADVYPNGIEPYNIDLEGLDQGMEGAFRPGHFKGVCMVVERLFNMVKPNKAFFGNKDFQQLAIIRKLVSIKNIPVDIVGVPIKRSEKGLALSSRNALLTADQLDKAPLIYNALLAGLQFAIKQPKATEIKNYILQFFEKSEVLEVEYVAIVNNDDLKPVEIVNKNCSVCIVVFCGKVRLIDNMQFATVLN